MDGYAVIASDIEQASEGSPIMFDVIENLPAGYAFTKTLKNGQAIRIMTGAPAPPGADSVIMVEYTEKRCFCTQ